MKEFENIKEEIYYNLITIDCGKYITEQDIKNIIEIAEKKNAFKPIIVRREVKADEAQLFSNDNGKPYPNKVDDIILYLSSFKGYTLEQRDTWTTHVHYVFCKKEPETHDEQIKRIREQLQGRLKDFSKIKEKEDTELQQQRQKHNDAIDRINERIRKIKGEEEFILLKEKERHQDAVEKLTAKILENSKRRYDLYYL